MYFRVAKFFGNKDTDRSRSEDLGSFYLLSMYICKVLDT